MEEMNTELVYETIDYYKSLLLIKAMQPENTENKILDFEIAATKTKLQSSGVNTELLEIKEVK